MSKTQGIEKFSLKYYLLKKYVDLCFRWFYNIKYIHKKETPVKGKLIFAGNHQNALMDALAILTSFTWQPIFLARSDIFRNSTLAAILKFLKIVPVYRIRDGYDQLANNQESFEQTFRILDKGNPIVIFPEGNHLGVKRIRSFKKGIARIAFDYLVRSQENKDMTIVPVGLTYTNYHKTGSPFYISFGKQIKVADFSDLFASNPAKGYQALLNEIAIQIKAQTLHVEQEDLLEIVDIILNIPGKKSSAEDQLNFWQQAITRTEELYQKQGSEWTTLTLQIQKLNSLLAKQNLTSQDLSFLPWTSMSKQIFGGVLFMLSMPLFFYAWIQIFLPNLILKSILKKVKDPHFKSSVRFVGMLVLYPVFFFLQAIIFGLISGSFPWAVAYFLTTLPSPWIVKQCGELFQSITKGAKLNRIKKELSSVIDQIKKFGVA